MRRRCSERRGADRRRRPLAARRTVPIPPGAAAEVRVRVHACGCCRTDLHVVEGDLDLPHCPWCPVTRWSGRSTRSATAATRLAVGDRVGVPWLHHTDGVCEFCLRGEENLCEHADFTGWTVDGGYADVIDGARGRSRSVLPDDARRLRRRAAALRGRDRVPRAAAGRGAAGRARGADGLRRVGAPGDAGAAVLGLRGGGDDPGRARTASSRASSARRGSATPPSCRRSTCDRAVVFAPAGELVPVALQVMRAGGTVSLAGIHMSTIPAMPLRRCSGANARCARSRT